MARSLRSVKFGLYGLHKGENTAPEAFARRAREAEEAGFESIWVGDHIALPPDAPDDAYDPRLEAVVSLAHLAAVTRRVRLGFGVLILPQRQPVLLAKQLTSIDVLSEGRLIVGFGVGYLEAELRALGASLADRGAMTDEYLAAIHALWDEPPPDFGGRFVVVLECHPAPAPDPAPASADRDRRRLLGRVSPRASGRWLVRLGADARANRRHAQPAGRRSRDHAHPGATRSDRPGARASLRPGRR